MTYNEFRLRFAIAYVGGVSDPGECMRRMDNAPALARLLWDVMNAPEVEAPPAPSFVPTDAVVKKSESKIALIPPNSMELKKIARKAREVIGDEVQWIAIDRDGSVWAYDLQPGVSELSGNWDNSDDGGFAWEITQIAPPDNFRDELYEINKLLNDDTE